MRSSASGVGAAAERKEARSGYVRRDGSVNMEATKGSSAFIALQASAVAERKGQVNSSLFDRVGSAYASLQSGMGKLQRGIDNITNAKLAGST